MPMLNVFLDTKSRVHVMEGSVFYHETRLFPQVDRICFTGGCKYIL